ncbi:glycosyltransferase [Achromobacter pulmonis]|nr:glycosyltransferase [Achromobacter pulmonis]
MKVSIVIPCYNAIDKVGRCLASLELIDFDPSEYEVIFVDDCSTDGTYDLLDKVCAGKKHWRLLRLQQNSGSPSRPRNHGIDVARGEYIYFLDCDDEILPSALRDQYALASRTGACVVRSELLAYNGRDRKLMNQLPGWHEGLSKRERIELIIGKQSTVPTSFIKTELLRANDIRWPEEIRMGEDTLFLARVLLQAECVEYLPSPSYVYFKLPALTPASTQRYGRRELRDHLQVWTTVQGLLKGGGVDYFKTRLYVGLRVALESLIFRNRGDVDPETFQLLQQFVSQHWPHISSFKYSERITDLLACARSGGYDDFQRLCRPRLLIAGHDLKFISDAIPDLSDTFDIRLDEWTGHATHDESASLRHLEWAEFIWCEWLLKNAEWYAAHKRPHQRLVVRMHRMELDRTHGEKMNVDNIDAIVTVSALFFERLLERFPNIPRWKVRLIDNYVRLNEYRTDWHPERLFTLGMIGILPARKGLLRALRILRDLREQDSRFRLEIFGHKPENLAWVARNRNEMAYFHECSAFIEATGLKSAVRFNGHANVKSELAARHIGYVLSVSDSDYGFPGPESFHLAVADAFAAGGIGVLRYWPGAEYIWPQRFIHETDGEIVDKLVQLARNHFAFGEHSEAGRVNIMNMYSLDKFIGSVKELFLEIA